MSYTTYQPAHASAGDAGHQKPGRGQSAASVSRHVTHPHADGYTLTHCGRQVRIGPVAFWIVVGTLMIMAVWSIATGSYFAFRDDVLTRLIGRQAKMQIAYEDRIAELRTAVDRITSRQLLDQEQFEQKLNALLKRQTALEHRAVTLGDDLLSTGSVPQLRKAPAEAKADTQVKPSPISDTVIFVPPPDREARLQSREPVGATRIAAGKDTGGLNGVLARVAYSLDSVERQQAALLTDLEQHFDGKVRRIRSVLDELGVKRTMPPAAIGGPFVPARPPGVGATAFERQLYRIKFARAQISRYSHTLASVPVRKPVGGSVDTSSPFGVRTDPFNGRAAMHTGLDLRGDRGEPVHATANGKVTHAGWEGGYGKMIEIDHGDGIATRYGHLSKINVKVGQTVRVGQILGLIGSTGRSTGPHLHYETRINNEAVNPQKFLRAGIRLGRI
jgi:murein DD-endopeptidase MepM/ murein hydrolase activator NlpD